MRIPLKVWWLAAACQLGFVCPGTAQDQYHIVNGPGAGQTIFASGKLVTPALNPVTRASGTISDPDACGSFHFHGLLFDLSDPHPPQCGWGQVIAAADATRALDELMEANRRMLRAGDEVSAGDLPGASLDIRSAINALDHLDTFLENADIDANLKLQIRMQVALAEFRLEQVIERFETPPFETPLQSNFRRFVTGAYVDARRRNLKLRWGQFSAMYHSSLALRGLAKADLIRRR